MIKCATSFKLKQILTAPALNEALEPKRFTEIGSTEMESVGFVPFADGLDLIHEGAGIRVGKVRIDKKTLPGSAVKEKLKDRIQQVEQSQGFKPGRKQTNELKEQIIDELLPTALATTKYIPFYIWDDRLVVESTSGSSVDIVVGLLAKCIDPFPVEALHLNQSPAGSMTTWLVDDEAHEGFTIDNEVEMKSTRSEEHTSELQSLMLISYAVFCLKKKKDNEEQRQTLKKIHKESTK